MSETVQIKICSKCKRELPATNEFFHRIKSGLRSRCKKCMNQYYQEYYQKHKGEISLRMKRYYQKHKGEISLVRKRYWRNHKEEKKQYNKQHYQKHKGEISLVRKRYYQKHKKEREQKDRQYIERLKVKYKK